MKAYIIRHGEKSNEYLWNNSLKILDNSLNENGPKQAIELGLNLLKLNIDKVYISEYRRAKETILPYCEKVKCTPIESSLINEINMGKFNLEEEQDKHEEYFLKWYRYQKKRLDYKYEGGESGKEALKRVKTFFKIIENENTDTIIVSHEGWIKLVICYILNIKAGKKFYIGSIKTCSILEIEYEEEAKKWKTNCINGNI